MIFLEKKRSCWAQKACKLWDNFIVFPKRYDFEKWWSWSEWVFLHSNNLHIVIPKGLSLQIFHLYLLSFEKLRAECVLGSAIVFKHLSWKILQHCLVEYVAIFLFSKILFKCWLPGQITKPSLFIQTLLWILLGDSGKCNERLSYRGMHKSLKTVKLHCKNVNDWILLLDIFRRYKEWIHCKIRAVLSYKSSVLISCFEYYDDFAGK